jgi:hypothetical protein
MPKGVLLIRVWGEYLIIKFISCEVEISREIVTGTEIGRLVLIFFEFLNKIFKSVHWTVAYENQEKHE